MRRRRDSGKNTLRKICFVIVILCLAICISGLLLVTLKVEPNLDDVAKIRAEVVVSRTINKALAAQFQEQEEKNGLFIVENGEDGSLAMVQADAMAINVFMSELSMNLQEAFRQMEEEQYAVPVGTLLGSKILSQTGPEVTISIIPMSVSSMDFRTEFESQGINQTKYKIYIDLECRIKVLAPFSSAAFNTQNTVLIAEAVILGDVPNSYVQVPEEDILDVMDE